MHKALPAEYFKDGDPILLVYVNNDKCFAFVELNSIELTSACCQLDGLQFKGVTLKIRRPNDFRPELLAESHPAPSLHINMSALGVISTTVADGPNKVFVGGLPYHLNEDMVKELLNAFGELKSFHLVRDPGSVLSKGYAFCEYVNPECTRIACEGLNDMQIGDKNLTVRIAAASSSVAPPPPPAPPLSSYSIPGLNAAVGSLQPLMSSSEVPFAMRSPTNVCTFSFIY
jgi:splicing factor U2AF subunit